MDAALAAIPKDSAKRLERYAVAIDRAQAKAKRNLLEIGEHLAAAHTELANHGDGTFGAWVESRCGMNRTTAFRHIQVFREFGDCCRLQQSATTEALYYLARESTPEDAIEAAKNLAEKGERITLAKAKELVSSYTDSDPEEDEWSLSDAIEELDEAIRKKAKGWPSEQVYILGEKLVSLGEEFKEMGVTECSLKELE